MRWFRLVWDLVLAAMTKREADAAQRELPLIDIDEERRAAEQEAADRFRQDGQ